MTSKTSKADIAKKTKALIRDKYWMCNIQGMYQLERYQLMDIVYKAYQEGYEKAKSEDI